MYDLNALNGRSYLNYLVTLKLLVHQLARHSLPLWILILSTKFSDKRVIGWDEALMAKWSRLNWETPGSNLGSAHRHVVAFF